MRMWLDGGLIRLPIQVEPLTVHPKYAVDTPLDSELIHPSQALNLRNIPIVSDLKTDDEPALYFILGKGPIFQLHPLVLILTYPIR